MSKATVTINNVKLRMKEVRAVEMMSFLTIYGQAVVNSDFDALDASYTQLLSWVEAEVNGQWIKIYDKQSDQCLVTALQAEFAKPNFIMQLMPLIEPFIERSAG